MNTIQIQAYHPSDSQTWDALVERSKNGTFLLRRSFMDYHQDRFTDCSLLFFKKGRAVACFPANWVAREQTVYSHQGLTYGGLIAEAQVTASEMLSMFDLLTDYYRAHYHAQRLIYKPIPDIYSRYPSEEDLYCLFKQGATLVSRGLSSAIDMQDPLPMSELRRRRVQKAKKAGLHTLRTSSVEDIAAYWTLLDECLQTHHHVHPVHSASEMALLMTRFPNDIQLHLCYTKEAELLAGVWCFISGPVLHTQYLASSNKGRELGALDLVISNLIASCPSSIRYIDFGISTEDSGRYLNEGLLFQKEGFGGRGVCYDGYAISIIDK